MTLKINQEATPKAGKSLGIPGQHKAIYQTRLHRRQNQENMRAGTLNNQ
jgi:hypothetical protein